MQQVRPGGEQQQTASKRKTSWPKRSLPGFLKSFSLHLDKPNILHKTPDPQENMSSPLIWTDRWCLASVENIPMPGCEPRGLFPHWSFTSGSSGLPDWPLRRTPGLWANLGTLQEDPWRTAAMEEKKADKNIQAQEVVHQRGRTTELLEKGALNAGFIRPLLTLCRRQGRDITCNFLQRYSAWHK